MIKYKTLLKVISKIYLKTYNKKTFQVFKHDFVLQNILITLKNYFLAIKLVFFFLFGEKKNIFQTAGKFSVPRGKRISRKPFLPFR